QLGRARGIAGRIDRESAGESQSHRRLRTIQGPHPEEPRKRRLEGCGPACGLMVRDALRAPHHEGSAVDLCRYGLKRRPAEAGLLTHTRLASTRSGGLAVDLRKIVLRILRTLAHELADILGTRLGAGDEHFAAGAGEVRLDLIGFAQRLRRSELVDAGEESFRVLVQRLLDIAA